MRHGKKTNHLGRTSSHRSALLKNLSNSLIKNKRIETTLAKAKELRKHIEPLITKGKSDNTHSRRVVFSYLQDKDSINELFGDIAEKVASRNGGYTRIIKLGKRLGDNADTALIELVDYNDNIVPDKDDTKKSSRSRRGGKKKASEEKEIEAAVEAKADEIILEKGPAAVGELLDEEAKAERKEDAKEDEAEKPE